MSGKESATKADFDSLQGLLTKVLQNQERSARDLEQSLGARDERIARVERQLAETVQKLQDSSGTSDAALIQANRALHQANRERANGNAVALDVNFCPKDVLCNPAEWNIEHFRTTVQREYWERAVSAHFKDVIPKGSVAHHEIERQLPRINELVLIWVQQAQMVIRLRGNEHEAEAQQATENTILSLQNHFSNLSLLYVKHMPEGGPEAMRKIENERKVRPFGEAERAEIDKVVKQHDQSNMFRQIVRATRATSAPYVPRGKGGRGRGGKNDLPDGGSGTK